MCCPKLRSTHDESDERIIIYILHYIWDDDDSFIKKNLSDERSDDDVVDEEVTTTHFAIKNRKQQQPRWKWNEKENFTKLSKVSYISIYYTHPLQFYYILEKYILDKSLNVHPFSSLSSLIKLPPPLSISQ